MARLGYSRYVAQGGDWGAVVTTAMGQLCPPSLAGIHLNRPTVVPARIPATLTREEQTALDALKVFDTDGSAYFRQQVTRPQTVGYGLADSPSGQAAWGGLFARQLAKAVYDVVIGNGRGADFLASLLRDLGPGIVDDSATKAAVAASTRGWARDFGPKGITVNVVQPGPINTDMNPADDAFAAVLKVGTALGRYGTPEEVAAAVAFVASPDAAFITGATLDVDGGFNA